VEKIISNTHNASILELFKLSTTEKGNYLLREKAINSEYVPDSWRDKFMQALAFKSSK